MAEWKGAIFDLDGVIVSTSRFHFLAWQKMADLLGFSLDISYKPQLDGVSRMEALEVVLKAGDIVCGQEAKRKLADQKNAIYLEMINNLSEKDLLPGAKELLQALKEKKILIALGSASKNAEFVLNQTGIKDIFDAVVDGRLVKKAKPDPEVFLIAAQELGLKPSECVVFEDAKVGVEAANLAGMSSFGIGDRENLKEADNFAEDLVHWEIIASLFEKEELNG